MPIAFRSAVSGNNGESTKFITLSRPSGVAKGDVMLAFAWANNDFASDPALNSSGWTELSSFRGHSTHARIWKKIATASEPASYEFEAFDGTKPFSAAILVYSGASQNLDDIIRAQHDMNGQGNLSSYTIPAESANLNNTFIVRIAGGIDDGVVHTITSPSGVTVRTSQNSVTCPITIFDEFITTAGSSAPSRTVSFSQDPAVIYIAQVEIPAPPPQTRSVGSIASSQAFGTLLIQNNKREVSSIPSQEAFGSPITFSGSRVFGHAGNTQSFTVPSGVTVLRVTLHGACGGSGAGQQGAQGGYTEGHIAVTPGEILRVEVGGRGLPRQSNEWQGGAGGYNGGGRGGDALTTATSSFQGGAGGGGASDIRRTGGTLADRILVAGGGGGNSGSNFFGGGGGGLSGQSGTGGSSPGAGGDQSFGGLGGGTDETPVNNGGAGALGLGGTGGTGTTDLGTATVQSVGGGGGGGGFWGGGGGGGEGSDNAAAAHAGTGGGGSGYIGGAINDTAKTVQSGSGLGVNAHGRVTIQWVVEALNRPVSGISSAEAFGSPRIKQTIKPTGISSTAAVGTPQLNLVIKPTSANAGEAFGTVSVQSGPVTVAPTGIASAEAVGAITTVHDIDPAGITTQESVGSPTVQRGTVTLSPSGVASAEAFGTTRVFVGQAILPTGIASTEAFGSVTADRTQITFVSATEAASSGNVVSFSIPKPAGVVEGDLMFAAMVRNEVTGTVSAPAGWTVIEPIIDGVNTAGVIFWKRATASEPSSYTFTNSTIQCAWAGIIAAYRGTHATDTVPAADGQGEPSILAVSEHSTPAITTTGRCWLLAVFMDNEPSTWTPPTGFIEREEVIGQSTQSVMLCDNGFYVNAGSQGAKTATASVATDNAAMWQIAIREATFTIGPGGIGSDEQVGTPRVIPAPRTVNPTGIDSGEEFGTPAIHQQVYVTGIASEGSVSAATVTPGEVTLTITGMASTAAVGTPLVEVGPATFHPTGVESEEAFGEPTVVQTVSVTGIASAEAFGTPAVQPGPVSVLPGGIASEEVVNAIANVVRLISPTGIASGEAFGTAQLNLKLVIIAIPSGEAFGTPLIGSTHLPAPFVVIDLTHEPSVTLAISAGKDLELVQATLAAVLVAASAAVGIELEAKEFTTTRISP